MADHAFYEPLFDVKDCRLHSEMLAGVGRWSTYRGGVLSQVGLHQWLTDICQVCVVVLLDIQ